MRLHDNQTSSVYILTSTRHAHNLATPTLQPATFVVYKN